MADEKVLIVDDDPAIRKLLTKVVENNGFKSMTAANGQEAVALAQNRKFDLILLDIMMNGVDDGFDAIRNLRATGNDIPIVILSGRTEDFDTLYGLDIGADDYITKPFNPVVLGAKIKALIRRKMCIRDRQLHALHGLDQVLSGRVDGDAVVGDHHVHGLARGGNRGHLAADRRDSAL